MEKTLRQRFEAIEKFITKEDKLLACAMHGTDPVRIRQYWAPGYKDPEGAENLMRYLEQCAQCNKECMENKKNILVVR